MAPQQENHIIKASRVDNIIQGAILLAMIAASWVALNSRVTALEVQQRNDKQQLERVEKKVDQINDKLDNYILKVY